MLASRHVGYRLDFYRSAHRNFWTRHHVFHSMQNLLKAQSARLEGMSRVQECDWGLRA